MEVARDTVDWLVETFGQLNSVLIVFCAYVAWLHYKEVESHGMTRGLLIEMQEKSLSSQMAQTVVLTEIKSLLVRRRGMSDEKVQ